ncbi:MAG: helicase C-terminal domain-containing protein [Clostridia bacterium]|nr:helicase C-terminal domain-containing protein [Clostridia bacterium]
MRYNRDMCQIETSVRELCNFAFRHGDLEGNGGADNDLLPIDRSLRDRISKDRTANYLSDVPLEHTLCQNSVYYNVSGRVDGVFCGDDGIFAVEVIKEIRGKAFYSAPNPIHMAQAKCYAYFLCERDGLERARARVLYFDGKASPSDEKKSKVRIFDQMFLRTELRSFYEEALLRVEARAKYLSFHEKEILPSIRDAHFPYGSVREGQSELIENCYLSIKRKKRLMAQAPTGIGKTVSTLYAATKALGDGLCDKVFYLTAKATTRREAFGAAKKIFESGAKLKAVVLYAKEQLCKNFDARSRMAGQRLSSFCNSDSCELARGYYDRVDSAIFELLSQRNGFNVSVIEEVAAKYRICPYEFSLDLSEFCDVIICDYNYVFDPSVYLRRYFSPSAEAADKQKKVFLIDEAHNLPDRARDMYSAGLIRSDFEKVYSRIDRAERTLNPVLEDIILSMRGLRSLCRENLTKDANGNEQGFWLGSQVLIGFNEKVVRAFDRLGGWLRTNREDIIVAEIEKLHSQMGKYLSIAEIYGEGFYSYVELNNSDTLVRLFCLDPSHVVDLCLRRAVSSVMFSATLEPIDYYADILGSVDSKRICLDSPFDQENLCVVAVDSVSTRFEDREKSYKKIANYIAAAVCSKVGNYIVYFPSYSYMEKVCDIFRAKYPNVPMLVQKKGMLNFEKEAFLDFFEEDTKKLRVGFCVLGGSFSEGVDLPGSRLIGTVIVGVGLPGLSNERNIMREYFENKCENGYNYAYVFPGMNSIMQAAGRVIRREDDKGIVVLIDDRYSTPQYRAVFPSHWSHMKFVGNAASLAELTRRFWEKHESSEAKNCKQK